MQYQFPQKFWRVTVISWLFVVLSVHTTVFPLCGIGMLTKDFIDGYKTKLAYLISLHSRLISLSLVNDVRSKCGLNVAFVNFVDWSTSFCIGNRKKCVESKAKGSKGVSCFSSRGSNPCEQVDGIYSEPQYAIRPAFIGSDDVTPRNSPYTKTNNRVTNIDAF